MKVQYKIILPLALVALLAAGCNKTTNTNTSANSNDQVNSSAAASTKFTDQTYHDFAYLISGDTLSADAQKATTGFKIDKKAMPDGTTQITLTAQKTGYKDQQFTLRQDEQLYFIEKSLGDDDNEANEDRNLMDDLAVVVDSDGNVVGQPGNFAPSSN